ncbi:MAG: lanthionine synthetase LanC family protein [Polyangiales bacterium]
MGEPTLLGALGPCLLLAATGDAFPGADHATRANALLSACAARASEAELNTALHDGVAGLGWVIQLLDRGPDDPNEDLDLALADALSERPWPGDFDFMQGLAGTAIYALERAPRPSAMAVLARIVERLGELSSPGPTGRLWHTTAAQVPFYRANERFPLLDCGVLHGQPGVLYALAGAAAWGVEGARTLLDEGMAGLLALRQSGGEGEFPSRFPVDSTPLLTARVGWCYGDLGVAATLLQIARAAGNAAWARDATDLAMRAAQREPPPRTVLDAPLCHGAMGLAHLNHALHRMTGEALFRARAIAWFQRGLAMRGAPGAFGPFATWRTQPPPDRWENDPGFLEGQTGIGLALADALGLTTLPWDRAFALSLRTP